MKNGFLSFTPSISFCAVAALAACSDDAETPKETCVHVGNKDVCNEPPDSADEVGDGDGDGPAPSCTTVDDGRPRTVIQCNGSLTASIDFNTILGDCGRTLGHPDWCDETHFFGASFDSYEMPAVMACCDDAAEVSEEEMLRHCAADMIEQMCRSIPLRIQSLLDKDLIKIGKGQAKALKDWLNENQQECFDTFARQANTPGVIEPGSWKVNRGKNPKWPSLHDFTIKLEKGVVDAATLPDDESEHLICFDTSFNNSEVFEEHGPGTPDSVAAKRLDRAPTVSIVGPSLSDGRPVVGFGRLGSRETQCEEPHCSLLELDQTPDSLTVASLDLFADGPVSISYGGLPLGIQRAALRLYGVSRGSYDSAQAVYLLAAGDAHFIISGLGGHVPAIRWAINSTPISLRQVGRTWLIDQFTVAHVDGAGGVWTVTVPQSTWY